jgi:hypothetical protein
MINRGSLFGVPSFRWIPARSAITVSYWAAVEPRREPPSSLTVSNNQAAFL